MANNNSEDQNIERFNSIGDIEAAPPDENRRLPRRSPIPISESGIVSRDYQPRTGGPELIAAWPLGPAPSQSEPALKDWKITDAEYSSIQRNVLTQPLVGPIDYSKIYLNFTGHGYVDDEDSTLYITLMHNVLEGKPYETEIELSNTTRKPFMSPMIEFTPEISEYGLLGKVYSGYELMAKTSGGVGYLDPGSSVQLFSE